MRRAGMRQIGAVATEVGLPLQTVRHFAEIGLVVPSGRTAGGLDLYTDADLARLRLVRQMQALHSSVDEIRSLLEAQDLLVESAPVDLTAAEHDADTTPDAPAEAERVEPRSTDELSADDLRRLTTGELFADDLRRLDTDTLDDDERARILDRLSMFSAAVEERCRQLNEQLDEADATASNLRRELRRHSRSIELRR